MLWGRGTVGRLQLCIGLGSSTANSESARKEVKEAVTMDWGNKAGMGGQTLKLTLASCYLCGLLGPPPHCKNLVDICSKGSAYASELSC